MAENRIVMHFLCCLSPHLMTPRLLPSLISHHWHVMAGELLVVPLSIKSKPIHWGGGGVDVPVLFLSKTQVPLPQLNAMDPPHLVYPAHSPGEIWFCFAMQQLLRCRAELGFLPSQLLLLSGSTLIQRYALTPSFLPFISPSMLTVFSVCVCWCYQHAWCKWVDHSKGCWGVRKVSDACVQYCYKLFLWVFV